MIILYPYKHHLRAYCLHVFVHDFFQIHRHFNLSNENKIQKKKQIIFSPGIMIIPMWTNISKHYSTFQLQLKKNSHLFLLHRTGKLIINPVHIGLKTRNVHFHLDIYHSFIENNDDRSTRVQFEFVGIQRNNNNNKKIIAFKTFKHWK